VLEMAALVVLEEMVEVAVQLERVAKAAAAAGRLVLL
tara:strand:+ start:705 stop:815 length:111 start_codon:yes stop_codon:yes gene_type:complete